MGHHHHGDRTRHGHEGTTIHGRITAVYGHDTGTVLADAATASGFVAVIGQRVETDGVKSITITLSADAAGDSCIIAGGSDGPHIPISATDTRGNTYHLGIRPGHAAADPDNHSTAGLDGTAWIMHGTYDAGVPRAGDVVTINLSTSGSISVKGATYIDCLGIGDDDLTSAGSGVGTPTGNPNNTFNPAAGKTISNNNSIYFGVVFGLYSDLRTDINPPHSLITVASSPTISTGTNITQQIISNHALVVVMDRANAGAAPSRQMTCGTTVDYGDIGWCEGLVQAYIPATIGGGGLVVEDSTDFNPEGGTLSIGGETIAYTGFTDHADGTSTIHTVTQPVGNYDPGTFVYADTALAATDWRAIVQQENFDDGDIDARIPHRHQDALPEGIRDVNNVTGEAVTMIFDGVEYVITDVLGKTLSVDGSTIDPTTLPIVSDGYAPASPSPTPSLVAGTDHIKARWTAVALNANGDAQKDLVTYDVYIADLADAVAATLDTGAGAAEYLLTAVTAGAGGNAITLTVTVSP